VAALLVLATIYRRPVTLTFDLLTLKSVWESHVTWDIPVQSFVFLGLLVFELEPMYATSDGQTDGRRMPITALCPLGGGIITGHTVTEALTVRRYSQCSGGIWYVWNSVELQEHAPHRCPETDAVRRTSRYIFSLFFAEQLAAGSIQIHHHQQWQQLQPDSRFHRSVVTILLSL